MALHVLLLRYNKPTNEAFECLANTGLNIKWGDLQTLGPQIDTSNYSDVGNMMSQLLPFDAILVGDVFWPTGQNICKWSAENKIPCYFLQHGQWKYVTNKRNPQYLPAATFVYGEHTRRIVKIWPYGMKSQVLATGNPRYDDIKRTTKGEYVYFAPPVMYEQTTSGPAKTDKNAYLLLHRFSRLGLSKSCKLLIHPHYREGNLNQLREMFQSAQWSSPEENALKLIQKSRLVLTHRDSTTVLDAIACGKPSVLMNFHGSSQSFFSRGHFKEFAIETTSPENCIEEICKNHVLDLDGYVDRAKEFIVLDGAGQRIRRAIEGNNVSQIDTTL